MGRWFPIHLIMLQQLLKGYALKIDFFSPFSDGTDHFSKMKIR